MSGQTHRRLGRIWLKFGWIFLLLVQFFIVPEDLGIDSENSFYVFTLPLAVLWLTSCIWGIAVLGKERIWPYIGLIVFILACIVLFWISGGFVLWPIIKLFNQ
jgi:hypothetical protein